MKQMEKIALYMRISEEDTDLSEGKESESIIGQRMLLMSYVKKQEELSRKETIEIVDDGYSGTNFERPGFQTMIKMAREGEIQCIIIKDFSRLGRNYLEVGTYLEEIFPFLGVRVLSVNDQFDSFKNLGAVGSLDVAFKNLMYEAYSKDLSTKVRSVRRMKASQGQFVTAYAPYGYLKDPKNKNNLLVDREAAKVIQRIYAMFLAGIRQIDIARQLNDENIPSPVMLRRMRKDNFPCVQNTEKSCWTGGSVAKILEDERYIGSAIYGRYRSVKVGSKKVTPVDRKDWIIVPNQYESIITPEDFWNVQERKQKKQRKAEFLREKKQEKRENLFAKKIVCSECNHGFIWKGERKNPTFSCVTWRTNPTCTCYRKSVKEQQLQNSILQYLQKIAQIVLGQEYEKRNWKKEKQKLDQKCQKLQDKIKSQNVKIVELYESYKHGFLEEENFKKKMKRMEEDIEEKKEEILRLERRYQEEVRLQKEEEKSDRYRLEEYMPFQVLTKEMVDEFVQRIWVNKNGEIQVEWKFQDLFLE